MVRGPSSTHRSSGSYLVVLLEIPYSKKVERATQHNARIIREEQWENVKSEIISQ